MNAKAEPMPPIQLRPTTLADLDFVLAAERDPVNRAFIGQWTREEHVNALGDADFRHFIVERIADRARVGHMIFQGLTDPNQSIQLRRIVITEKGAGYGRAAVFLAQQWVFAETDAHRFWLDVKDFNLRAQHLYTSVGFVAEGLLRECIKAGDRFESFIIMSILRHEYEQERNNDDHRVLSS